MNKSLTVANVFIALAKRDDVVLSNMKLHKLMFFAQGHSLGLRDKQLIDELPEAWTYGPVYPRVYQAFKQYGSDPILKPYTNLLAGKDAWSWHDIDEDDGALIQAVWNGYKHLSPIELSQLSHVADGPWDRARKRAPRSATITPEDMRAYFAPSQDE